ncbi:MAG: hypothetical protein JWM16_513 [Verrucomicrobiales bacterium]|jgi:hypothetical protein|nr:hypothetical protein [Verrucomicrobiales bacterium]
MKAKPTKQKSPLRDIESALRRAGKQARRIARAYGTPIYVWENGKVVAKQP